MREIASTGGNFRGASPGAYHGAGGLMLQAFGGGMSWNRTEPALRTAQEMTGTAGVFFETGSDTHGAVYRIRAPYGNP